MIVLGAGLVDVGFYKEGIIGKVNFAGLSPPSLLLFWPRAVESSMRTRSFADFCITTVKSRKLCSPVSFTAQTALVSLSTDLCHQPMPGLKPCIGWNPLADRNTRLRVCAAMGKNGDCGLQRSFSPPVRASRTSWPGATALRIAGKDVR